MFETSARQPVQIGCTNALPHQREILSKELWFKRQHIERHRLMRGRTNDTQKHRKAQRTVARDHVIGSRESHPEVA